MRRLLIFIIQLFRYTGTSTGTRTTYTFIVLAEFQTRRGRDLKTVNTHLYVILTSVTTRPGLIHFLGQRDYIVIRDTRQAFFGIRFYFAQARGYNKFCMVSQ